MKGNTSLELPEDPDITFWAYYSIGRVTAIVNDDFLLLILAIPCIDKFLQMNLYNILDLLVLHAEFKLQFTFFRRQYLVLSKHGMYTALHTEYDIHICMVTQGYLYIINQALNPAEQNKWCIWLLSSNIQECINKHLLVNSKQRCAETCAVCLT